MYLETNIFVVYSTLKSDNNTDLMIKNSSLYKFELTIALLFFSKSYHHFFLKFFSNSLFYLSNER